MRIEIQELTGRAFYVDVASADETIEVIKLLILASKDIEPNLQRLVFKGELLQDDWIIRDCGIFEGSTLDLVVREKKQFKKQSSKAVLQKLGMEIIIENARGKTFTLDVEQQDTIGLIKQYIEDDTGIPAPQQRLLFEDQILDDEYTLAEYDIKNRDVLNIEKKLPHKAPQKLQSQKSKERLVAVQRDQDSDEDEEEEQRIRKAPQKLQSHKSKGRLVAAQRDIEENNDGSEDEDDRVKRVPKKLQSHKSKSKIIAAQRDDEEEEEEDEEEQEEPKKKTSHKLQSQKSKDRLQALYQEIEEEQSKEASQKLKPQKSKDRLQVVQKEAAVEQQWKERDKSKKDDQQRKFQMTIKVGTPDNRDVYVKVDPTTRISTVLGIVCKQIGASADTAQLFFGQKQLVKNDIVADYGIMNHDELKLVN
ncbi:MAG: putative Polyubiquitin [Streblomastix strix]|uniref:Putative Polyubiquitin n=1 Tax=Streblomastix strix TaxID=222440 RepID=A0A5J4US98_9EUKA|nr:MAG: putative Polyubiquitin [Streblomastix strix]